MPLRLSHYQKSPVVTVSFLRLRASTVFLQGLLSHGVYTIITFDVTLHFLGFKVSLCQCWVDSYMVLKQHTLGTHHAVEASCDGTALIFSLLGLEIYYNNQNPVLLVLLSCILRRLLG